MGKPSPTSEEAGRAKEGTLTAVAEGNPFGFGGHVNLTIWGTFTATVVLKRSFDGGTTFHTVARDSAGTAASFTAPTTLSFFDAEPGVIYRLDCTEHTSGTVNYRFSQ